jgi:hypothetical protein
MGSDHRLPSFHNSSPVRSEDPTQRATSKMLVKQNQLELTRQRQLRWQATTHKPSKDLGHQIKEELGSHVDTRPNTPQEQQGNP